MVSATPVTPAAYPVRLDVTSDESERRMHI